MNSVINWSQRIERITTRPEYAGALIEIHDDSLVTWDYDIDTGEETVTGDSRLQFADGTYQTRARVVGIRSERNVLGGQTNNPSEAQDVRVSFPWAAYPARLKAGFRIEVVDGGRNPALATYGLVIVGDNLNSNRASHVVHCRLSTDVQVEDGS